jgi:hypothetical protein
VLLAARYQLHDVDDVEALCVRAARTWATKTEARLSPHDFESLTAFLIEATWRMSTRYDPARSTSFRAVVAGRLGNRCIDWLRQHRGRTGGNSQATPYERDLPRPLSLDQSFDGDPLGASLGSVDRDFEAGRLADPCGGLLGDRDSEADWDLAFCRALAERLLRERGQRPRAA